jgi:hypothetical protein
MAVSVRIQILPQAPSGGRIGALKLQNLLLDGTAPIR